ncbi:MAG: hypothetical protein KJ011_14435 [Burkholderiaceae bacterium]|nr:hypothetical protein [Burkholderiaceae bacterium]
MSFAFDLQASPGPALRALRVVTVTLAAGGFALAAWLAPWPWGTALALAAGVPACGLAWRRGARGLSWGRLVVDASGCTHWQVPDHGRTGPVRPVRIERWCATGSLVWLRLRGDDHRCRDVLIARHDCDAQRWRCLQRWLRWLGRGPEPAGASRSA